MPNLVKSDDARGGTKANIRHGWLEPAQASISRSEIQQGTGRVLHFNKSIN